LVNLRLRFSLVLTPLFLWGAWLAQARQVSWAGLLAGYFIVHVLLYGGMNAFNSYYDRDEGPIGALADPPPVDRWVLGIGLFGQAAAVVLSLLLGSLFAGLTGLAVGLSVLYSHPRWRWKERPALAAGTIFVGQGVLGVLWGWAAVLGPGATLPATALAWLGVCGAALWTLGFYPLTGAYQVAEDARRGVRTLAVALGVAGCFRWLAGVGGLGGLLVAATLFVSGAVWAMVVAGLYLGIFAVAVWRWRADFAGLGVRANQRRLMRLGYANGLFFSLLFGTLLVLEMA
jgi:1,4-dihydroxy-2-naphthoate octaprenyltransferase